MTNKERWITVAEAVKIMKMHRLTINRYCRTGILECKRPYDKRRCPWKINILSIPAYLRK